MKKRDTDIKKLRVLFIGSSISSKILLKKSIDLKLNLVGVCTKRKSNNLDFCNLKQEFKDLKIPFKYVNNINSTENYKWIKNKKPDLIFCFGWSSILKYKIIKLAKKFVLGFHPTELPKNKGRHPIIWSLALGLKKTASSFFVIKNESPDSGNIISQKKILIKNTDNAEFLYKRIMKVAQNQLEEIVYKIKNKKKINLIKNFHSNFWRKREYADGKIDWRMSASNIHNLVRALSKPYMYAHFNLNNKEIKIIKSKVLKLKDNSINENFEPGKILVKKKLFFDIKCGSGILRIFKTNLPVNLKMVNYL